MNATGFRKILKKFDKNTKLSTKELYLSRQVEIQPCFNKDILTKLADASVFHEKDVEVMINVITPEIQFKSPSKSHSDHIDYETLLTETLMDPDTNKIFILTSRLESSLNPDDNEFVSRVYLSLCCAAPYPNFACFVNTLSKNININISNDVSNRTCLHEAASLGNLEVIKFLTEMHDAQYLPDIYDKLPVHHASINGHAECVKYILSKNQTQIQALDCDGNTPLVYAIRSLSLDSVKVLFDEGAKLDQVNGTGLDALSIACHAGNLEMCALIISYMDQLKVGEPITFKTDSDGVTALHIASRAGYLDIVKLLIKSGMLVNEVDGINGWSAIFYAASDGNLSCCEYLANSGCTFDFCDSVGWHPCTYATYHGHKEVAELLSVEVPSPIAVLPDVKEPIAPSSIFDKRLEVADEDVDAIPSLELPPPILPFRIYGHNYLKSNYHIRIGFSKKRNAITFFKRRQLSTLKLVITSQPDDTFPHTILLPLKDDKEQYSYTITNPNQFSFNFEIYPAFGSNLIGKGVLTSNQLKNYFEKGSENSVVILPLFELGLNVVGEIEIKVNVIKPFEHPKLQIGGKADVYWKSTTVNNHNLN